ncbi:MAG: neutral/alkaline ceramidase [Actinomycetota bacterium]|nr:neutral/alkaline ceramidase [Actinomycetota bacterium]
MRRLALPVTLALAAMAAPAQAASPTLEAGAGKADITPKLGYYLGGWTRADRVAGGQHTRLHARALVLKRGDRKVALVAIDLFMVPGGLLKQIGDRLAARGFSEQNILMSASHTHSGPGGYANYPTLNTAAPSMQTATDPASFFGFFDPKPADPELYRFLYDQISKAIERADDDLAPAAAGWGSSRIVGLTRNRSLEAHLANHGIIKARGEGDEADDPGGYEHTIDPDVDVLRVDKVVRRRGRTTYVPIGGWTNFADHGTVTKSSFQFYNQDHHASAFYVFEKRVRRTGRTPAGQEVVNVYGNSNEGDMSAGLTRHGPAASDYVGRIEGSAMVRAWERAGRALQRKPQLDFRWTRVCFCGQEVEGGQVDDHSEVGQPFLTGSEEERGPLYDMTGDDYEDTRSPIHRGPQGYKNGGPLGDVPTRVPLVAIRVGPRLIASIPGEATKEVGARTRSAVAAAVAGAGIERVAISGLANEFVLYFTTPEEYERQHYEGGNTHFGTYSSNLIRQELARLAGTLVRGEPAPAPVEFDPTNGVRPDGPLYGDGAASGSILEQPAASYPRLGHAAIAWQGGPEGLDRPVDRAFLVAERRVGSRWVRYDDDLGLAMLWRVNGGGRHDAFWEVPRNAPLGTYRFVVQAKRYRLVSREFRVEAARTLSLRQVPAPHGYSAVVVEYPEAQRDIDITTRPKFADGGAITFRVGNRRVRVTRAKDDVDFTVRVSGGVPVFVDAGQARDRHGNVNGSGLALK